MAATRPVRYCGRLESLESLAKEWAEQARGWHGAQGGWIYSERGTVCQGWGALYQRYSVEILDWHTRRLTGFESFDAMLTAPDYRPTILPRNWRYTALADAYDLSQQRRSDPRRAYRG